MTPDLWIFGYGSLIWDPGFDWDERVVARVRDWHRSFCMWSIHHRGTPDRPGLVLALDLQPGAVCEGVAFRVPPDRAEATRDYLRARELVSSAYLEVEVPVDLDHGTQVQALTYVVDRRHPQYCGGLSFERQVEVIAAATGGRGPNPEYLWNTQAHLAALGIADPDLDRLADAVRRRTGTGTA
ncbi:MAG: gamma-glutamylcyclotransferase [Rhodobacteraceae bacterium]|jgi:cation transport protein ChaC|nr:gamma-glutamylcyclotransferase [Paracoccaceae bacterium]